MKVKSLKHMCAAKIAHQLATCSLCGRISKPDLFETSRCDSRDIVCSLCYTGCMACFCYLEEDDGYEYDNGAKICKGCYRNKIGGFPISRSLIDAGYVFGGFVEFLSKRRLKYITRIHGESRILDCKILYDNCVWQYSVTISKEFDAIVTQNGVVVEWVRPEAKGPQISIDQICRIMFEPLEKVPKDDFLECS